MHLGLLILNQILWLAIPADIGLAPNHSSPRAGGIDQDGIKGLGMTGGIPLQIRSDGDHRFTLAQAQEIFPEQSVAATVRLHRHHRASRRQQLCQMRGFTAKSGAAIKDTATIRQLAHQRRGQLGGLVLNLKQTVDVTGQGDDGTGKVLNRQSLGAEKTGDGLDAGFFHQGF